jgi:hypothetical protein
MAQGSQNTASILDFLYVDRPRLASYAAQLFNKGVLRSTKTQDATAGSAGGGVAASAFTLASVNAAARSETRSQVEQEFDASHSLPLNVLDRLDELGYISPDIKAASLGDLFLIQGKIRFLDYRLLKDCWDEIYPFTVQQQQQEQGGKLLKASQKEQMKNIFKLMKALPHSTELILHHADLMVWTNPNPEHLTVASNALMFSHGSSLPGTWGMLASLDGKPEIQEDFAAMPMVKEFQFAMWQVTEGLRQILGRPYAAYAATPLVIYREILPFSGQETLNLGEPKESDKL